MTDDTKLILDESRLYDVYTALSDACQAAASGDPNECARLASVAKDRVEHAHAEAEEYDD